MQFFKQFFNVVVNSLTSTINQTNQYFRISKMMMLLWVFFIVKLFILFNLCFNSSDLLFFTFPFVTMATLSYKDYDDGYRIFKLESVSTFNTIWNLLFNSVEFLTFGNVKRLTIYGLNSSGFYIL